VSFRADGAALLCGLLAIGGAAATVQAQVPGRCEIKASRQPAEVGCYLLDSLVMGRLSERPVYWHLYTFPSKQAADAETSGAAITAEAYGRHWLFALGDAAWRPDGGTRVAVLGPIPFLPDRDYTAHFAQSMLVPGLQTRVHRHPGPEVFYVLEGAQCVELQSGRVVTRAGESAMTQPSEPMQLRHYGRDTLRSLLLILHESDKPLTERDPPVSWQPTGACGK
jgi:quercetin dioxygenase-like cupin family protein